MILVDRCFERRATEAFVLIKSHVTLLPLKTMRKIFCERRSIFIGGRLFHYRKYESKGKRKERKKKERKKTNEIKMTPEKYQNTTKKLYFPISLLCLLILNHLFSFSQLFFTIFIINRQAVQRSLHIENHRYFYVIIYEHRVINCTLRISFFYKAIGILADPISQVF